MNSFTEVVTEFAKAQRTLNWNMMVSIESEAWELLDAFRAERGELQAAMQRKADAEAAAQHKKPRRVWCPLNLFVRDKGGSLVIGWQLINYSKTRKIRIYESITTRGGDYDLRTLLKHSLEFERELIERYERRARKIRRNWRNLMAICQAGRTFVSGCLKDEDSHLSEQNGSEPPKDLRISQHAPA